MNSPGLLRPVPRWIHRWAVATAILTLILLGLGGFVTSFRVGMADPVWPTEPWYLANNFKLDFGYLVEHTHRIVAYLVGGAATILALAVWFSEPHRPRRVAGLVSIIALLASFGLFNKEMRDVWNALQDTARNSYNLDAHSPNFETGLRESKLLDRVPDWPVLSGALTAMCAVVAIGLGVASGVGGAPGGWLRCLAVVALVAVMVQGLLGGFRVFFNVRAGLNLAAIHGAYGQLTFCVLAAIALLSAPRVSGDALNDDDREYFTRPAWGLAFLLTLQLVFAVLLRHFGSGSAQRLHILLAFGATGMLVWLITKILARPGPRDLLRTWCHLLSVLLALQLLLGVESYLGKFAATGPQAQLPPDARAVSKSQALVRTSHQWIGSLLLGTSVIVAMLASRRPQIQAYSSKLQEKTVPPVAAMALEREGNQASDSPLPPVARFALDPPPDDGLVR